MKTFIFQNEIVNWQERDFVGRKYYSPNNCFYLLISNASEEKRFFLFERDDNIYSGEIKNSRRQAIANNGNFGILSIKLPDLKSSTVVFYEKTGKVIFRKMYKTILISIKISEDGSMGLFSRSKKVGYGLTCVNLSNGSILWEKVVYDGFHIDWDMPDINEEKTL